MKEEETDWVIEGDLKTLRQGQTWELLLNLAYPILVSLTCGSESEAEEIEACIDRKLAACVNICPVKSIYVWQGKLEQSEGVKV